LVLREEAGVVAEGIEAAGMMITTTRRETSI
jgi:hypothetical protein